MYKIHAFRVRLTRPARLHRPRLAPPPHNSKKTPPSEALLAYIAVGRYLTPECTLNCTCKTAQPPTTLQFLQPSQALLAYIAAGRDLEAYWAALAEGGVTRERLASFDRAITHEPDFTPGGRPGGQPGGWPAAGRLGRVRCPPGVLSTGLAPPF